MTSSAPAANSTPKTPSNSETAVNEHQRKAYYRGTFDTTVDILVGPKKKQFRIHKQLLCDTSPYFEAALKGQFKEAQEQSIVFLEESAKMFEYFQLWLYSGKFLSPKESVKDISFTTLCELYLFGEMRGISGLQNAAIDLLIDREAAVRQVPITLLQRTYQNTPDGSPLRRLFVDWMSYSADLTRDKWFVDSDYNEAVYPVEFLVDLTKSLYVIKTDAKAKKVDILGNRTKYHTTTSQ